MWFYFPWCFDLRSLEGALVCLCKALLMDVLEEQAQLGTSLGQEAHRLGVMAHTSDDDDSLWRLERHLIGPILSLHHPNNLPLEARALHLRDWRFVGARVLVVVVVLLMIDTWHFLKRRSLSLMEKTLVHEQGGLWRPNVSSPSSTTFYKCQNITLERVDVIFRVSYVKTLS